MNATAQSKLYGYIRVSTKEQNEDRQITALKNFGIADENIFMDKMSGKDFKRPQYKKLIKKLKPADTVVFKSIDRLGRNFYEILEQWKLITEEKQACIVILDMPILDTRHQKDDLTSQLISTLVLQILSYVAQIERDFIRQRQSEGIAAAKARGVKFGRKPISKPANFPELFKQWQEGGCRAEKRQKKWAFRTLRSIAGLKISKQFELKPYFAFQ